MKPLEANLTGSVSKSMRNHMQFASLAPSFQMSSPIPQSNSPISSNINILSANTNPQSFESPSQSPPPPQPQPPLTNQYEFNPAHRVRSASAPSPNFPNTGMSSLSVPLANNNQVRVSSPLSRTDNSPSADTALQFLEDALSNGPQNQQQQQQQQQQQPQQFLNPGNASTMSHNNSWSGYSQIHSPPIQRQQSPQTPSSTKKKNKLKFTNSSSYITAKTTHAYKYIT
ncbi:unnamed protein product [[Candida] boidinii]|nr:unnamed protein product [[Candida] boidinii]